MLRGRLLAAILVVVVCAACGSAQGSAPGTAAPVATAAATATPTLSPSPSPAALAVACDLLTHEVAQQVLGGVVGQGDMHGTACLWGRHPQPGPLIQLKVLDPSVLESSASPAPDVVITPVSDLGDEAFFSTPAGESSDLFVRSGTTAFRVTVTDSTQPDDAYYRQTEEAVAQEILANL